MTERFYPKPRRYFAALVEDRRIFQGDIFRGGFGAFWRHPEARRAALAGDPTLSAPRFPAVADLQGSVLMRGTGYGMLLPQPCEFSEGEKGATPPFRLVAPLFPLDRHADVPADGVRNGTTGHTLWVPRWHDRTSPQDYYVDLRYTASIDAVFLTRATRVAALSIGAWTAMADRLSRYFVGSPWTPPASLASRHRCPTPHRVPPDVLPGGHLHARRFARRARRTPGTPHPRGARWGSNGVHATA